MPRPLSPVDSTTLSGQWGANFRTLRVKRFSSQVQFMEALEDCGVVVNQRTVSNWEHGTRLPHLTVVPYIAKALGVHAQYLLPDGFSDPPELQQPLVVDEHRRLTRAQRPTRMASADPDR